MKSKKSAIFLIVLVVSALAVSSTFIWFERTSRIAGGLVYNQDSTGVVKYLLVTRKYKYGKWILPKGKATFFESLEEAAMREVREETGVLTGSALKLLTGPVEYYKASGERQEINFFLLKYEKETFWIEEESRRRIWVTLDEAQAKITAQLSNVLSEADEFLKNYRRKN